MLGMFVTLGVWLVAAAFFLFVVIACLFYPRWIQRLAVRQYESSRDPVSRLTTWIRQSEFFVWYLRVVGVVSLWGVVLSVLGLMQALTDILGHRPS